MSGRNLTIMTLEEFATWLKNNPEHCKQLDDNWSSIDFPSVIIPRLPLDYEQFLKRFGPVNIFGFTFLSKKNIPDTTAFIRSLAYPQEGISYDHLTAFCSLGADNCYLCFDGERVVDFDPMELNDPANVAGNSFTEFLDKFITAMGEPYWLRHDN